MSCKRYTEEFNVEAVKQKTERGHSVAEVTARWRVASIHVSEYYAWRRAPLSARPKKLDRHVIGLIKRFGGRAVRVLLREDTRDLRDPDERCGKDRVARLMLEEGRRAQIECRRRSGMR